MDVTFWVTVGSQAVQIGCVIAAIVEVMRILLAE